MSPVGHAQFVPATNRTKFGPIIKRSMKAWKQASSWAIFFATPDPCTEISTPSPRLKALGKVMCVCHWPVSGSWRALRSKPHAAKECTGPPK